MPTPKAKELEEKKVDADENADEQDKVEAARLYEVHMSLVRRTASFLYFCQRCRL